MYLKKDDTGAIGEFLNYQVGYTPASAEDPPLSQAEIDAYNLTQGKTAKIAELKRDLSDFRGVGFVYSTWTFNLTEDSARYVKSKADLALGDTSKYKFWDKSYIERDFTDSTGFDAFSLAINEEEERLMELYNSYRNQITACTTIAQLDAIVISFAA